MVLVIVGGAVLLFSAGYIAGAKATDKKHGVIKHWYEY